MYSMIKKIDILGIQLDNYTVREAIRQVEAYLDNGVLNSIECISMQMLIHSEDDTVLREVMGGLDLAIIGEKEILRAAGIGTMQRMKETEENDFSFEFFKRVERNKKSVFVLGQTAEKIEKTKGMLHEEFPKLVFAGEYAIEKCKGNLETVINDMNATAPDVIVSVLPTPLQEHFFREHKDKMSASIWYGIGEFGITPKQHGVRDFFRSLLHLGKLKSSMEKYQARSLTGEAGEDE